MRSVDGVSYMRFDEMPGAVGEELDARDWRSLDRHRPGRDGSGCDRRGSVRPGAARESTVGASRGIDGVERIGTEDVRGVATTHYRGHIDVAKAIGASVPDGAARRSSAALGDLVSTDSPVDVWIDADGQTRKMLDADRRAPMMTIDARRVRALRLRRPTWT